MCIVCLVTQSCPNSLQAHSLPGSFVHGILQARILGWVAMKPEGGCRGSSQPRNWTQVSCIAGRFFTIWATREVQEYWSGKPIPSPGELSNPGIEPGYPALQGDSFPVELPRKLTHMCITQPWKETNLSQFYWGGWT